MESATFSITINLNTLKDTKNRKNKKPVVIEIDNNQSLTFIPKRFNADAVTVFSKYPDNGTGCGLGSLPTITTSTLTGAYSSVHIKPVSVEDTTALT